jgi:hypothetical protein
MEVQIPSYMQFVHDEQARKATIAVQDRSIRKQREMWGEFFGVSVQLWKRTSLTENLQELHELC